MNQRSRSHRLRFQLEDHAMPDPEERYLAVFAPDADVTDIATALATKGIKVADRYDFIRTLVLTGNRQSILALPQTVPSITSVEKEGIVRIPE